MGGRRGGRTECGGGLFLHQDASYVEKPSSSLEGSTKSPVKDLDTHHEKYLQVAVFRECLGGEGG